MQKTIYNYEDLQHSVDTLIGKFGLKKTIEVLESLSENTQLKSKESDKIKLLFVYIVSKSIKVFDLKEEDYYTNTIQEYREARMSCYYLLRKYTGISYRKIGEDFKQTKRAILYNYQKCEDMLSIPTYYKEFADRFKTLEDHLINFIAKLK